MIPQGWRTLSFNMAMLVVFVLLMAFLSGYVSDACWKALEALTALGNIWLRLHTTTPVCTKPVLVNQSETTITNTPTTIAGNAVTADTKLD